jgi:cell division control protein 45
LYAEAFWSYVVWQLVVLYENTSLLNTSCLQSEEEGEGSSEADSAGEGGAEESRQGKRRRLDEEAILKRRERRLWEEKRDRLMFDYTQFSYYGRSVSLQ